MSSSISLTHIQPLRVDEVLKQETQDGRGVVLLRRVLWVDPGKRRVILFDLLPDAELRRPYWDSLDDIEAKITSGEYVRTKFSLPGFMLVRDDEYQDDPELRDRLKKSLAVRDRNWKLIEALISANLEPGIYLSSVRGPLVARIARENALTNKSVLRLLYRVYKYGRIPNALLPKWPNCGAPGVRRNPGTAKRGRPPKVVTTDHSPEKLGVNIDEETRRIILRSVDLFCGPDDRVSLAKAYDDMKARFFVELKEGPGGTYEKTPLPAHMVPTLSQFSYYAKERLGQRDFIQRRIGENKYALKNRGLLGSARANVIGPGHLYEIDSTVADIYLLSRYNVDWVIGRPIVYVVIDTFSRLIAGLHVGLIGPSWESASQALANAFSNKVEFCAAHGHTITEAQWPAHYIPFSICADRGEVAGNAAEAALQSLNVTLAVPPPYRPDWKAAVERRFRILNDECIDWIPGAVRQRQREMRKRSYLQDATLDIEEFTQVIIACVLEHNLYTRFEELLTRQMIADGVEPYPVDIWHWGVANLTGPLRIEDPDLVRTHLLPRDRATVTARGIQYKGLTYSCQLAVNEGWFDKARRLKTWPVDVRREYTTNRIYLAPPSVSQYQECHLLDRDERFANTRFEEAVDCMEYLRLQETDASDRDERGRYALRRRASAVIDSARQRKKRSNGRFVVTGQKIKEQRQQEATIERALRIQRQTEPTLMDTRAPPDKEAPVRSDSAETSNVIDLLKRQRRDRWSQSE